MADCEGLKERGAQNEGHPEPVMSGALRLDASAEFQ